MAALDDIIANLAQDGWGQGPAAASNAPGAPLDITPQGAAAAALTAPAKKADDWMPPSATFTPPPVANVPFSSSSGMIAPQTAPQMGSILAAPAQRRWQYIVPT